MFWNATNAWKDMCLESQCRFPDKKLKATTWDSCTIHARPRTAGVQQKSRKRHHSHPTMLDNKLSQHNRPNTAPALLTGEGLLMKRPHQDSFLQKIENNEVQRSITAQRREKMAMKTWGEEYNQPVQPRAGQLQEGGRLYELNLYHGATQRLKTQRLHKQPQRSKSEFVKTMHDLQEVSRTMDGLTTGTDHYAYRSASSAMHFAERSSWIDGERITTRCPISTNVKNEIVTAYRRVTHCLDDPRRPQLGAGQPGSLQPGSMQVRSRPSSKLTAIRPDATSYASVLQKMAPALEEKYGNLKLAFKAFANDGRLSAGDLQRMLGELALGGDAGDLFRQLNLGPDSCMGEAEFESVMAFNRG